MPNKVALSTRTHLVPFGVEDFDRLISWLPSEGDLVDWCAAYFRYPLTRSQLDRYLDSSKQPNVREIFTAWTENGEAVGHLEISQIWPYLSSRLSRVLVAPRQRRRGIARSMMFQALTRTFDLHHVAHVDLGVSVGNSTAIRCYESLGFARAGIWSNAIAVGSYRIDVQWMTLTRDQWFPIEKQHQGEV